MISTSETVVALNGSVLNYSGWSQRDEWLHSMGPGALREALLVQILATDGKRSLDVRYSFYTPRRGGGVAGAGGGGGANGGARAHPGPPAPGPTCWSWVRRRRRRLPRRPPEPRREHRHHHNSTTSTTTGRTSTTKPTAPRTTTPGPVPPGPLAPEPAPPVPPAPPPGRPPATPPRGWRRTSPARGGRPPRRAPPPPTTGPWPRWVTGSWMSCSRTCSTGWQSRTVQCKGRLGKLAKGCALGARPSAFKHCMVRRC
ncbi:A disintegrin and metalloproteinase with thrombospondin motifs 5-like [Gadus macrocephalus]|uniref:A disintegrin and metalloproteinase with thrombospondin motifs 5-like n=1 Tax=Gadus macrocephalus TaxID=80720 RepID=UPI0028CB7CCB|nr:A disintegrin and metalloproteinase with thrombospondin motifs 5-like [Gadus macrocephalus]